MAGFGGNKYICENVLLEGSAKPGTVTAEPFFLIQSASRKAPPSLANRLWAADTRRLKISACASPLLDDNSFNFSLVSLSVIKVFG